MRILVRLCCALTAALALSIAFSSSQKASAATFTVDNTGDASDVAPGNGTCADPSGACTLRAAIQEANSFAGNDTINISATGTINLTGVLPDITSNMSLNGPGSSLLTVRRDTGGDYRIFFVNGAVVSISELKVTNGRTPDGAPGSPFASSGGSGGGIFNGGTLTLTDVVVTGNNTGNGGAGGTFGGRGGDGGGIASAGTLTMTNCVVSNNTTGNGSTGDFGGGGGNGGGISFSGNALMMANSFVTGNITGNSASGNTGAQGGSGGSGAGIYLGKGMVSLTNVNVSSNTAGDAVQNNTGGDGGHGGGIYVLSDVATTMTNSTISNNSSGRGGPNAQGGYGGGIANHGPMTMIGCVVSNNFTKSRGEGGGSNGGGIFNNNILSMMNCTVSGNRTDLAGGRGGGIYNIGNPLTLTNSTITANLAYTCCSFQSGQGIHTNGTVNISNTIIAGNGAGGLADVTGNYNSRGHNFIGSATSGTSGGSNGDQSGFINGNNGDQVGTSGAPLNSQLGPLADNGGPTRTHALLAGSPALDAGNNALARDAGDNPLMTDQRGAGRIADSTGNGMNATVDIGAFEYHQFFEPVSSKTTNEDTLLSFFFNIGDANGSSASITASSDNTGLVPEANLTVSGSTPLRVLRIVPAADQFGTARITLTVTYSDGAVRSSIFLLTVLPANDAPTFTVGSDQIVSEDSGSQTVINWATNFSVGPNESGQALSFLVNGNTNAGLFSTAPLVSPSGTLTYTLAPNANGSAVITVSLKDDGGNANGGRDTSDPQTFRITVTPVNDAPVAVNNSYSTNEDTALSVSASGVLGNDTDNDSDPLAAELVSAPNNGSVMLRANGSFTYTPNANFNGPDTFTYRVSDGNILSNVATVSLTVHAVNDAPINMVPAARQNAGTTPLVFSAANANLISITDIDAGNNSIRVTLFASNGTLTLKTTGGLSFSAGDGTADSNMTFTGSLSNINAALDGLSFIPRPNFSGLGSLQIATNDLANTGPFAQGDTDTVNITILPGGILKFSATSYQFSEGVARATLTVLRTGDTTGAVSVSFATVDDPAAVPCDPTIKSPNGALYPQGVAYARCDYATTIETVTFAAGDSQPKLVNVPLIDDAHVEGAEILQLKLSNPTDAAVDSQNITTLTIQDNDTGTGVNPIFTTPFFVRMQYLDFLSREPEAGEPWTKVLNDCSNVNDNPACDRILVSQSFFGSPEFRLKGFFVYNFYSVAFNRRPTYEEIIPDMRSVTGATEQEVYQKRAAFPVSFTTREEFKGLYDAMGNTSFVNTLLDRHQLQQITTSDPANPESGTKVVLTRADLIGRLDASGAQSLTRAQLLRAVVESDEMGAAEFNRAFVAMQYYGYLRRTPEEDGYQAWLRVINQDSNNVRVMVNGFMNSTEYRLRFGPAQ